MMDPPPPLPDISETSLKSRLALEEDVQEDEPQTLSEAHWWVQPRWVKVMSVVIGVPSFLYLSFSGGHDPLETPLEAASFIGFALVAAVQMIFVLRAYWRMDI